jgi:hypothetical protein
MAIMEMMAPKHIRIHRYRVILGWLVLVAWSWAGCSAVFQSQPVPFQPPTPAGDISPAFLEKTATPTIINTPRPVVTLACSDNLKYLNDITIMDGTVVQPGQVLDKRWLVENNGSCNWNARYRLQLVDGSSMGVPEEQALFPARSGVQAEIRMVFIAPSESGVIYSAWQAYNPEGQSFGDPFYIEIVVETP